MSALGIKVPPLLSGFFTQNCLTASIVAFLIYDYVLTLGLELELFWCRRGAILSRLLFFVLRLSIIATAIMNVLSTFVTELEINVCTRESPIRDTLTDIACKERLTSVRAYAVTGGQCIWTTATSMLAFASFGCLARLYLGFSYQLINVNSSATCMFSPTLSPDHITILQLVLLSRLLINLREASDRDVYMSSEDTPNDNDEYPDTGIKQSTIRFNHTNTHSGAEEAFVDEQPSTIEEEDDADVHEELQDDLEWRAADSVRAQETPAADGGPSHSCA
ncbi:hypothetical protein EVJ58_g3202 [Rhodofomes roseus]|uniref:DUF6533 domain-containing protein n=1 Tax=Rhodofomes roseus TaxID=34475 RepID=A0A4Y9YN28_9APHY|nr:hypothetical protein EVJ58_g3202 [Rhodofomes roseus]